MSRELVAKRKVYYAKHEYAVGERFTAQTDRDAEAMILAGSAEAAKPIPESKPSVPPPPPPPPIGKAMEPEPPEPPLPGETSGIRRTYRRRDLRAEGE